MPKAHLTHDTCHSLLRTELVRRAQVNPRYSMRAFARDLGVAAQNLSAILKGKRKLSAEAAAKIAARLDYPVEQASYFCDLSLLERSRTESERRVVLYRLERYSKAKGSYRTLHEDLFCLVSDWYHYALLELTCVPGFREEPSWISSRLGITSQEAQGALERLERLGLVERADGNRLQKRESNVTTTHEVPSAAVRKLTQQLLKKASAALETQSLEERDFGTITMAIDPAKLNQAKVMIREFRRRLCAVLEDSPRRTQVYTFSSQLFRITQSSSPRRLS